MRIIIVALLASGCLANGVPVDDRDAARADAATTDAGGALATYIDIEQAQDGTEYEIDVAPSSVLGALHLPAAGTPACARPIAAAGWSFAGTPPNAGPITFTGENTETLVADANGIYESPVFPSLAEPGGAVTVQATGGAAPAFTATLARPELVTMLAPVAGDRGTSTVDRARDLAVAWTPVTGATVLLYVWVDTGAQPALACAYPSGEGSGVIPAALLSTLGGDGGQLGGVTYTLAPGGGGPASVVYSDSLHDAAGHVYALRFDFE